VIVADSAAATTALVEAVSRIGFQRDPSRRDEIRAASAKMQKATRSFSHRCVSRVLRAVLPRDGLVVEEVKPGRVHVVVRFSRLRAAHLHHDRLPGTLGFGFPTSLGVKAAHPDKPVVSITGDGGFMFAAQGACDGRAIGIGVVVLVFNNSAFGNVKRDQEQLFGGA